MAESGRCQDNAKDLAFKKWETKENAESWAVKEI